MIEYGKIAESYDERYKSAMSLRENEAICEILNRYEIADWSVLDVGCGTGFALDCIQIPRYIGIDVSKEMIDKAKEKHPHSSFCVKAIDDIQAEAEHFEVALCLFSIPYIKEESAEKIHSLLVKNGICICVYYNKPYLNADSVYFGREEEFNKDVLPKVKDVVGAFKGRFTQIENHYLTDDETYTVSVFRKEVRE